MKNLIPLFLKENREPVDAEEFHRALEVDVLARTIWGEARGEGSIGMQAVACVVMNRVKIGGWWGDTVVQVCQKPYQFSCWNKDDANYGKLLAVDGADLHFITAKRIALRAVMGVLDDPAKGATHYHAAGTAPYWIRGENPVAVIGHHIFYKLEG